MEATLQHTRGMAAAMLIATFLLASFNCGCRKAGKNAAGVFISTTIPWTSYVKSQTALRESDAKGTKFSFPQLEIYDQSGYLIYSGHETFENAQVLRNLPDGFEGLRPKPDAARLEEVLGEMPEFLARKGEMLGGHKMSVLSVFLEDCHACSIQEDALSGTEHQLLEHGVNLLVLHVSRGKP